MKRWLKETHGPVFELFRHFLWEFFDSDLITATGQTATALIGAISLLLPCSMMFLQPLKFKYDYFSSLPIPGPYREAVRADELWQITLMMSVLGVLTAIKWQSLFLGLRDYRVLASLPIRPAQLFLGKCLALVAVGTAAVVALNSLFGLAFPAISNSHWAIASLGPRILSHIAGCAAGCYFVFFALVALEGVLLNVLRPRWFERVTGHVHGSLVAAMLILVVLSFSIQPQFTASVLRSGWAGWLPPLWFLGLYQFLSGDPDPEMLALAHTAKVALAVAVALAGLSYFLSYRRHRALLVEGVAARPANRKWPAALLEWLIPDPRRQGIVVFILKTLSGSSQHRMILMGYGGFGLAILLSGLLGVREWVEPSKVTAAGFVYAHVILLVFLVIGLRHLFAMPTELRANWTFQITEREGRRVWMRTVNRLVLVFGAAFLLAIPFPAEALLLGWRALAEIALFAPFALLCYEWAFASWEKLPFTCSYLPGKTPSWILAIRFLALLSLLPVVCGLMLACLYHWKVYVPVLAITLALWYRIHVVRQETWGEVRLMYEDLPEPAVHGLDLLK